MTERTWEGGGVLAGRVDGARKEAAWDEVDHLSLHEFL